MRSTVTAKNQVTIPVRMVRSHGIVPGAQLEWSETDDPECMSVWIVPNRSQLARRVRGALRADVIDPGATISNLIADRSEQDRRWSAYKPARQILRVRVPVLSA